MMGKISIWQGVAIGLLAIVAVLVVIIPMLPGYDPYNQNLGGSLIPPGGTSFDGRFYLLGTDTLGRDMLSRLALAGQVSTLIGLGAVAVSLVVGVTLGLIAGYFRGPVEVFIMGLADLQLSIPRVLLLIAVTAIIGPSVVNLAIILGLTSWVAYGRVARGMTLSLREREFILSARTQGASATWNIRQHLLPNVLPQMLIVGSYEFGMIIVLEASLSCLRKVLLAGDQLLKGWGPQVPVQAERPQDDTLGAFFQFLDHLDTLPDDLVIFPGHGDPIHNFKQQVASIRNGHRRRLERLLDRMSGALTGAELAPLVFPNPSSRLAARLPYLMAAMTNYLVARSQLRACKDAGTVKFWRE